MIKKNYTLEKYFSCPGNGVHYHFWLHFVQDEMTMSELQ